jgi:hypothetical protein
MAALKKLKEHPDFELAAAEALRLFENMAKAGHDMSGLITNGLIKAVIEAMKHNPLSAEVQLHGFATLEHLLRDAGTGGKTGAKVAAELVAAGGVPVMAASLSAQAMDGNVVAAGLKAHLELIERGVWRRRWPGLGADARAQTQRPRPRRLPRRTPPRTWCAPCTRRRCRATAGSMT